jgi:phospholipase/lecithinase/hemolysin
MGYEYPIHFTKDENGSKMNRMVIFGDRLSDTGNLKRWLKVMPEYPCWLGRFSSGLTWSEYLGENANVTPFNLPNLGMAPTIATTKNYDFN